MTSVSNVNMIIYPLLQILLLVGSHSVPTPAPNLEKQNLPEKFIKILMITFTCGACWIYSCLDPFPGESGAVSLRRGLEMCLHKSLCALIVRDIWKILLRPVRSTQAGSISVPGASVSMTLRPSYDACVCWQKDEREEEREWRIKWT